MSQTDYTVVETPGPSGRGRQEPQTAVKVLTTASEQLKPDWLRSINALTALLCTQQVGVEARKALTPPRSGPSLCGGEPSA